MDPIKLHSFSADTTSACCSAITTAATHQSPLVVGITGEACAGKTYFSTLICEYLKTTPVEFVYFSYDDFLISRADREKLRANTYTSGPFEGRSYWEVLENWYRIDQFVAAIDALRRGQPFTFYPYLRSTGLVATEPSTLHSAPLILVDTGMYLEKMDRLILVTADPAVILERKRRRGVYRSWDDIVEIHEKVQAFHWSRVKPTRADIEITNDDIDERT